ncbi:hypothetical protein [Phytoactinopolyspora mesophila]|uniref:Uncharacterized protein n=1 Tax=Phytoactinopolyspora mesophila TaxID=2650750 RepID=A0A7K3M1W1_9ACTN|nr:hypothetical protein [Phytoactinopolyspora mesophila]NDL57027.1 hypothetical protein [Phytoactinopolyspora mesophila]
MSDRILTVTTRLAEFGVRIGDRLASARREKGASALEYVIVAAILFPIVVAAAVWIGSVISSRSEEIQP